MSFLSYGGSDGGDGGGVDAVKRYRYGAPLSIFWRYGTGLFFENLLGGGGVPPTLTVIIVVIETRYLRVYMIILLTRGGPGDIYPYSNAVAVKAHLDKNKKNVAR